jgi:hypothetical protein
MCFNQVVMFHFKAVHRLSFGAAALGVPFFFEGRAIPSFAAHVRP